MLPIEALGPSTALVTSRDERYLDRVPADLAYALDNSGAEPHPQVERLVLGNAERHHFGDEANVHGGAAT